MIVKRQILFLLGVAVLGAIAVLVFVHIRRNRALSAGYGDYRLYAAKGPFSLLVDKGFPNNGSFLLRTQQNPIVFSFDQSKAGKAWAHMSVHHVLSVNVRTDAEQRPLQLWILRTNNEGEDQLLQDLNIDDIWDTKLLLKANKHFIHIDNAWREVKSISGTDHDPITATSDDNTYYFDKTSGTWRTKQ